MKAYQKHFIEMALNAKALKFGEFVLKSGRISPYFFNIEQLLSAEYFTELGQIYAAAIIDSDLDFDILFGPAYKGIPLTCTTSIALHSQYKLAKSICFNRKEIKDHGEGGQLIGASVKNKRILLIDDVITAGTAVREAIQLLMEHQAKLTGIIVALDRQERGQDHNSAIVELAKAYQIPVFSIITLENIINYMQESIDDKAWAEKIKQYQCQYGYNNEL